MSTNPRQPVIHQRQITLLQDNSNISNGNMNPMIATDSQAARDAFDREALAPFTDTLFYDWDLGRFLDSVDSTNPGPYQHLARIDSATTMPEVSTSLTVETSGLVGLDDEEEVFFGM